MNSSLLAGSAGKCCECCWCPWTKEKCPQGSRVTLNSDGRPHKSQAPSVQRRQISHLEETPEGTCEDPRLFKSWVRKPGLQWRKATHLPAWAFSPLGHLVITPTILSPQGQTASTRMKSRGLELCCCVLVLRKKFKMTQIKYIKLFQEACEVSESEQMPIRWRTWTWRLRWDRLGLSLHCAAHPC